MVGLCAEFTSGELQAGSEDRKTVYTLVPHDLELNLPISQDYATPTVGASLLLQRVSYAGDETANPLSPLEGGPSSASKRRVLALESQVKALSKALEEKDQAADDLRARFKKRDAEAIRYQEEARRAQAAAERASTVAERVAGKLLLFAPGNEDPQSMLPAG